MLISDSHEFIFVHVRKAAGSSIRRTLAPYAIPRPKSRWLRLLSRANLINDYHRRVFRHHAPLRVAERTMPDERFRRYFKFAFVRNPWERLVSEYEFIRGFPGHGRHRKVSAMTFPEFVRFQAGRADAFQYDMLTDRNGELAMDFIGRFENLQSDFNTVCERIGVESVELPLANPSRRRPAIEYYDDQTAAFVREKWRLVIDTFGYRFEDLESRRAYQQVE